MTSQPQPSKILREADLHDYDGLKLSQRKKLIKRGEYPVPFALTDGGRAKGWWAHEIAEWQQKRATRHRLVAKNSR